MSSIITLKQLINASLDANSLEHFINGSDLEEVITRLGKQYPTLAKLVRKYSENGMFLPFDTQENLLAYVPEIESMAAKALDTKKVFLWKQISAEGVEPKVFGWVDQGKSELDQATSYFDSFFSPGINIFDLSKIEHDKYYNYKNGQKGDAEGFVAAGLYEIKPSTEYQVPPQHGQQMAFFDQDMKFIDGYESAGPTKKFTTPENAKYIGITVEQEIVDIMMLCESSVYPSEYVPFELKMNDLSVSTKQIEGFQNALDSVLEPLDPYYINIVTNANVKHGYYVYWKTGQISPVADHSVVGPCKILPNTTYQTSQNYNQQFVFLDKNFVYIDGYEKPTPAKTFITPANAKYAMFTVPDTVLNSLIIAEGIMFAKASLEPVSKLRNVLITNDQISGLGSFIGGELGLRPLNIIDLSKLVQDKYVDWKSGGLADNPDFVAAGPYEIASSVEYQASDFYSQQGAFYDLNLNYISGFPSLPENRRFITPENAKYIRLSVAKSIINKLVVAESSIFPEGYVSSDKKLSDNLFVRIDGNGVKTTEIWVSADLNDADPRVKFRGKNAIQLALDSITDASVNNRYIIRVKRGFYKITKADEFLGYPGYPAMILVKDHVDIVGQGRDNTIIWAELPYNDDDIGPSIDGKLYGRLQYQTVYNYADDAVMKDLTCIAKNLRYTIHIDNPNGANKERKFDNVAFIFKGNKGGLTAMGCGTSSGERTIIVGGQSFSDKNVPFASHNNSDFDKPSYWSFTSHSFVALANVNFAYMQNDGSLLEDQLELVGCSFGGKAYQLGYVDVWLTGNTTMNRDSFNHAEWHVTGHGNDPFLFKNDTAGKSLRFKTITTGISSSIRFDKTSSAFDLLIKNNQVNAGSALLHNSREFVDGYIVQDGSVDLPAQAWGCRDLYESVYLYDQGVNYTRLGVRLGDCSVNNKKLGVIVNGTLNNILFNKNYGPMMNSEIIAEMNAQLSGAVVDLVSYGRDYYPTITDVCEPVYNITSTFIPKGSLVAKSGGYVRLASGSDKVFGVALDDIPVMQTTSEGVTKGQGRVLKRGYISASRSEAFYVLADNQNPSIGTRFKVSNGQLVTDVNGAISVDIDNAIISINC